MDQSVFFDMTYGMYVIATNDGQKDTGCVVNTVCQVTAEPPRLTVAVNKDNYTMECIRKRKSFTVSILSETTKQEVIGRFGFSSGRDTDKFEGMQYERLPGGLPVLKEHTCGYLVCNVVDEVDVDTHILFIAEIVDGARFESQGPMTYAYYHKVVKGKAPKNAPTYLESQEDQKKEHVCSVCGYVYDGSQGAFEELPESYECPICKAKKDKFS